MTSLPLPAPTDAAANIGETERTPPASGNLGDAEQSAVALELPALVFCRSRKRVEGVARELAAALGLERVGACHAGLTKEERATIEDWFFHADDAVLVATSAYGRPQGLYISGFSHSHRGSLDSL